MTTRNPWLEVAKRPWRTSGYAARRTINSKRSARSAQVSWRRSEKTRAPNRWPARATRLASSRLEPPRQPVVHLAVPEERVARLEHPVVLVREVDEACGHARGLEHAADQQPLPDRHAVVFFPMNDQHRRIHAPGEPHG